ncbi:MAG: hypothetical protein Fur0022_18030 [Anaerolineales bacterium]
MTVLLAVAHRVQKLIGRVPELQILHQAIFPGDASCQIVFIQGQGGFGKTRLLEEVLVRLGTPLEEGIGETIKGDWQDYDRVVATQTIDLFDTRLHARNRFLQEARNRLGWMQSHSAEFNFSDFETALKKYQQSVLDNVEYGLTQQAAEKAIEAFWKDYTEITTKRRIVWAIDTAEQVNSTASGWLVEEGLLDADQLYFQAQRLLIEAIQTGRFLNTTLIFAGRGEEGKVFFEQIETAARGAGISVQHIQARPLDEDQVREYLLELLAEWQAKTGKTPQEQKTINNAVETLAWLTEANTQRIGVFTRYTGGQPVRLALFADLLVEAGPPPEMFADIEALETRELSQEEIEQREWQWEDQFITLLFQRPRLGVKRFSEEDPEKLKEDLSIATLRPEILKTLVRARLGLTAEQIHYLIDNPRALPPEEWQTQAKPDRIQQIAIVLKELRQLSLVKPRPPRQMFDSSKTEETYRIGLQDEIYRIFAEHMAPFQDFGEPVNDTHRQERARLARLRTGFTQAQLAEFEARFETERQLRWRMYRLLRAWAEYQKKELQKHLRKMIDQEERDLERQLYHATPANSRSARLYISEADSRYRANLRQALRELDLEIMHYAVSLQPERALNEDYFDLADEFWRANDEDADMLAQAEMWRILFDRHAVKFAVWEATRQQVAEERGEDGVDVIRRAARQEDASRWIKRLALRRKYDTAQGFVNRLEKYIENKLTGHVKISWQHTFADAERTCWKEFISILSGQGEEIQTALSKLQALIKDLENLAKTSSEDTAIPEKGEKGFIGHPGLIRLKRVISVIFANMAYGYTQLGDFRNAVQCYSKSLGYIRETGALAHRATVLNNLSRALSEMGRRHRPVRICLDALQLRHLLGADQPIGLSHSTLALIYNDANNADRAWVEAAKARLFFNRINDARGIGLACIQLGEALRRMAGQSRLGRALPVSREELYREAEFALDEAIGIFTREKPNLDETSKVQEPLRWIEVRIEKGCLFRDRVAYLTEQNIPRRTWQSTYHNALGLLQEAIQESHRHKWNRLELDALVNLAWTHFYAQELVDTQQSLQQAEGLIQQISPNKSCFVSPNHIPNPQDGFPYIYYQLSKIHGLYGRLALERFIRWSDEVKQTIYRESPVPWFEQRARREYVHQQIQQRLLAKQNTDLTDAANHFWLAITYAQLFSPRSTALSVGYDTLYNYLKKFNDIELQFFQAALNTHYLAQPAYKEKIKNNLEDLGDLTEFMYESLGDV